MYGMASLDVTGLRALPLEIYICGTDDKRDSDGEHGC
jgi:hypothetical protein